MKRVLIVILALTTCAVARDKKPKVQPGPYIFTSKASVQSIKALIVEQSLRQGYTLDADNNLQFRFSKPAQMPLMGAIFMASSACPGMTTRKVWSYTLTEPNGTTEVTVQPVWEYPDDYCQTQTSPSVWSQPEEIAAFQAMLDKIPPSVAQVPPSASSMVPPVVPPASPPISTASQSQITKQHADCLELAKGNPSIVCK
jgi:hypothetical protein